MYREDSVPGVLCARRIMCREDSVPGGSCAGRKLYREDCVLGGTCAGRIVCRGKVFQEESVPGGSCAGRILYWEDNMLGGSCAMRKMRVRKNSLGKCSGGMWSGGNQVTIVVLYPIISCIFQENATRSKIIQFSKFQNWAITNALTFVSIA